MASSPEKITNWWTDHGPESVLARRVKDLRIARGWSQQDLAKAMKELGLAWYQTTVSRVESGLQSVTLNEAAGLAMVFGLPPTNLFLMESTDKGDEAERLAALEGMLATAYARLEEAETALRAAHMARDRVMAEVGEIADRVDAARRRLHDAGDQQALLDLMATDPRELLQGQEALQVAREVRDLLEGEGHTLPTSRPTDGARKRAPRMPRSPRSGS